MVPPGTLSAQLLRMSSPLLKPRWLTGHVLVVVLAIAFTFLGFWQLDRHFEQQDDNTLLEARFAAEPLNVGQLVEPDVELRRAVVVGQYDYSRQLELRPRARNGQVGYDQILPLDTGTGVVLVNRGFIPDVAGSARDEVQARLELAVTGTVRASQDPSRLGPQNPDVGVLETIARIDVNRLNPQFDGLLLPVYLDLISESPPIGGLATVLPEPPAGTSRPHLPYAVQWWAFAVIVSVGWVVYLRKQFFAR